MNVLFLGGNRENYVSGYYHRDFLAVVKMKNEVFCYGPGYPGYDTEDRLEDVLEKMGALPDLIVLGTAWDRDDHPTEVDPHPAIRLDTTDIPKVMFLNKEYKKLDQRLAYIEGNGIDLVFSAVPSIVEGASAGKAVFVRLPYAVNTDLFKDYGIPQDVDFGFSGNLHRRHTDIRFAIRETLKGPEFQSLDIYWGEWGNGATFYGEDYARVINHCKVFLSTPSALDIVGPRFYEVMACRRLLFCPESPEYAGLFEPGRHCVTFSPDLSDFRDKLFWILENPAEREAIAARACDHVRARHSIAARAEDFEWALDAVLGLKR
ncbi:MAG: glycosyltransferase [Nitrospinota bacterium]